MIDRQQIEAILKANGVSAGSKDEEIRSVLLSARYNHDEVDTAVMVLRENMKTNKTRVDGLHKIFRTDQTLNSSEISALLGVDVDLEHKVKAGAKAREFSTFSHVLLIFLSIFLAVLALIIYMYVLHIGIFHPSSALASKLLG